MASSTESLRIGILGTGPVGDTLGSRLVELGHEVRLGGRDAANPRAAAWVTKAGKGASQGTFQQAAEFGQIVINATAGGASLQVLKSVEGALNGKVLIDVANAIDFNTGILPFGSETSLGEQIQLAHPTAKVIKTLNTMNVSMFLGQEAAPGPHNVFVAGNDATAKAVVRGLLGAIGWEKDRILDLGDITAARGTEHYMTLFWRLYGAFQAPEFNIGVLRK